MVILGGTSFTIGENIVTIDETTSYNLSDYISEEGADYYVFINADGRVIASTIRTPAEGYMFIGQFHTLCRGVGSNTTFLKADSFGLTVGQDYKIISYLDNEDLDFSNFYNKRILAVADTAQYSIITAPHALAGFNTMDILPESVWCLNFHPDCKSWDGMVYCEEKHIAVDIYHNTGNGYQTESSYGSVPSVNRYWLNYNNDAQCVKKRLPSVDEWLSFAIGSNNKSVTSTKVLISGGHVDSTGRRLVSNIGVEGCEGFVFSLSGNIFCLSDDQAYHIFDGSSGQLGMQESILGYNSVGSNWWHNADYDGIRSMGSGKLSDTGITDYYVGIICVADISIV